MNDDDKASVDWSLASFEGLRRRQRADFRALTLAEKILVLEQMQEVVDALARAGKGVS